MNEIGLTLIASSLAITLVSSIAEENVSSCTGWMIGLIGFSIVMFSGVTV